MRIREAEDGDAAAVTALWTEGYSGRGEGEGRVAPYEEREFFVLRARARVFVAVVGDGQGGRIAGVAALSAPGATGTEVAAAGEAELSRLVVAETARGEGVGRALTGHSLAAARELGAAGVALWSRPYQRAAHRLYEALGFARAPSRDGEDAEGRRVVFRRLL